MQEKMMSKANSLRVLHDFRNLSLLALLSFLFIASCQRVESPPVRTAPSLKPVVSLVEHPEWSHNLSIYEVNLRQYSAAGDFQGFESHLPRLKDLGVGILWFMPIHPIGEERRKGTLGSYYSVKDYLAVNPEYGSLDDFKQLVSEIHQMGMYVIIDWVANHTAWDNQLTVEHPDWYMRDSQGDFFPPVPDWSDVIDLNYNNRELCEYMIAAMKFWVGEVGIDGFRCDVAGMVPLDFWNRARAELEKVKPVFLLAEAESPQLHEKAFDMSYGWELYHLMNRIARGKKTADDICRYLDMKKYRYPRDGYRMYFTSNHDENSWNGTVFERLADGAEAFAVLVATLDGMPLVYSGQEAGLDHRLEFFEKDLIAWQDHKFAWLYRILLNLKRHNKALWNGEWGGPLIRVQTSADDAVFAFVREKETDKVFVVLNLSPEEQEVDLEGGPYPGTYTNVFTGETSSFSSGTRMILKPWGYEVFCK